MVMMVMMTIDEANELAHLRKQVTEAQARNTALEVRNRALAEDSELARKAVECAERMCADARAEADRRVELAVDDDLMMVRGILQAQPGETAEDAARRVVKDMYDREVIRERDRAVLEAKDAYDFMGLIRAATGEPPGQRLDYIVERMRKERDEARAVRDEALKAIASVTASRDALASSSVPVELARLYRAAQRARAKYYQAAQTEKLAEECGEYIAERSRVGERYDWSKVNHEIHDVLTVALSLCEPALMAASAERLEGRLST